MIKPTIHSGGTSKDDLMERYNNAYYALHVARHALYDVEPHSRDYHVQGPEAFLVAMEEHTARVKQITAVMLDIDELRNWLIENTD